MKPTPSIPLTMENLHHLRTPITLVRGYCMMMRDGHYGPNSSCSYAPSLARGRTPSDFPHKMAGVPGPGLI